MTIKYIKNINEHEEIDVIIPAAGIGKRMKSYGPKPLIKINNDLTIIENQLNIINRVLPNSNIILVCGFEANYLMNKVPDDIIKVENENYEQTNVVRSIGMGLRAARRNVLIIYGDLVFNRECLESMNYSKSSILCGNNIMKDSEVGCIENAKGKIENLMYDLENKWGQIMFLRGKELQLFKNICWNTDNNNMFGFEAINAIISRGGSIRSCGNEKTKIVDIDTSKDLEKVKDIL